MNQSTEPTKEQLEAFIKRAHFRWGWYNLESWARAMSERAVFEINELEAQREMLLDALSSFMYEFGDKANSATVQKARAAIKTVKGKMV